MAFKSDKSEAEGESVDEEDDKKGDSLFSSRMQRIHASCVALDGKGILIGGPSGAGKSDLALRLIMDAGAVLVADDYVELYPAGEGQVFARCPETLSGLLEVRYVGVVRIPGSIETVPVALSLFPEGRELARMPDPIWVQYFGVKVRSLGLPYFEASAVAKIKLVLKEGVNWL